MFKRFLFLFFVFMGMSATFASDQKKILYQFDKTLVCKGKQQARKLGLPTANVYPPDLNLSSGSYAGFVSIEGESFHRKALFYIPSNSEAGPDSDRLNLLEAHIIDLDFETNLYGQKIEGTILFHISDPVPWTTTEDMKEKFRVEKIACLKALEDVSLD